MSGALPKDTTNGLASLWQFHSILNKIKDAQTVIVLGQPWITELIILWDVKTISGLSSVSY